MLHPASGRASGTSSSPDRRRVHRQQRDSSRRARPPWSRRKQRRPPECRPAAGRNTWGLRDVEFCRCAQPDATRCCTVLSRQFSDSRRWRAPDDLAPASKCHVAPGRPAPRPPSAHHDAAGCSPSCAGRCRCRASWKSWEPRSNRGHAGGNRTPTRSAFQGEEAAESSTSPWRPHTPGHRLCRAPSPGLQHDRGSPGTAVGDRMDARLGAPPDLTTLARLWAIEEP